MHDIVIRGGTILDGTGSAGVVGDVAIDGDKVAEVGGKAGPGKREVDAQGLLVPPGWVDVHTHYGGQATWDPILAPSSWHGVTTILFGNCGVGFAPVRPAHREALIDLMEGVEDSPGITLTEGIKWTWESFPGFMDTLGSMNRTIDVAAQIPHHPLRVYVMGDRAIRREAATVDDIEAMHKLTAEAMKAGAFGFTTSRTNSHKTTKGDFVPGRNAEVQELLGIGRALSGSSFGAFGMNSDFDDESGEFEWITALAKETGRPVWFLLTDRYRDPMRWRRILDGVRKARAAGAVVAAQVAGRPVGVILGLATSLNPFSIRPSYRALDALSPEERVRRMRDPELRRKLLSETPQDSELAKLSQNRLNITSRWDRMFLMGDPPDYEPTQETSIAAIGKREGRTPDEVAYDYLTQGPDKFLFFPVTNYVEGDLAIVREMLTDRMTILGLADGGAHCASIIDASVPSFMLSYWGRDRTRGPGLPVEQLVKMQTSETADFFGFHDRGRLKPGLRADVNLIDFQKLGLKGPEMIADLPAGGRRLVQRVDGYRMTICAGVPTFEHGEHTGALPGRLVRAG